MKDDDKQVLNQELNSDHEQDSNIHTVQGIGTVVIDNSSPHAMLSGLVSTLGEVYGYQMFSNLTGIHALDGFLIPSCASEYDIIH